MARILILDDEQPLLQSLSLELGRSGHECLLAEDGRSALALLDKQAPDLAILDVQLPDMNGLEVLRKLRADLPEVPVLIITAYASVDTAVEAMKDGAIDYLEKPLDLEELQLVVDRELGNARLRSEVEAYRRDGKRHVDSYQIIGQSEALNQVRALIQQISAVPVDRAGELPTILIEGETGTGKDLLARSIHAQGPLSDRPFVQVNCSGLPRDLVESELFGHERGSFTGATQRKQGLFEVAQGGTIFLDEIGDMGLDIQTKLLNVLEGKTARRVGATREYPVDVRIIAATNRDLNRAVEERVFRSDLYYRLKVVHITLPPLRERRDDIALLADFFVERYRRKYRKGDVQLNQETLEQLREAPWPGNIRELAHTLEHLVLTSDGGRMVPLEHSVPVAQPVEPTESGIVEFDLSTGTCTLEQMERQVIDRVLQMTNGNVSESARLLGISRGSLRHRLEKWGIKL